MVKPATTASSTTSTESNAPTVSSAYAKYLTCCGSTVANTVTDPAWGCADVDCTSAPPASTTLSALSAPSRRPRRGRRTRRGRRRRSPTTSRSYPRDNVRLSSINSITEDSLFQNLPSSWRAVSCGPRSACSNDMYVANVNSGAMLRVPCCSNQTDESSCNADDQCTWNDASGDASGFCSGDFSNEAYCKNEFSPTERMESLRDALLEKPSKFSTIPHTPQFLSGKLNLAIDAETSDITYSCDEGTGQDSADVQIFVDSSCNAQIAGGSTKQQDRCKFWSCAKSSHSTSPVLAINSSGEPYTTTASEWNVPLCSFSKASDSPYSETDKQICTWNSRVSPARNFAYVTMNPCFYNPALDAGIRASSNTTAYPKCYDTVRDFWTGVVDDCDEKNWDSLACRQLALAASTSTDPDNNYGSMGVCGTSDGKTSIADACSKPDQKENLVDFFAGTATTLAPMAWSTYWTNATAKPSTTLPAVTKLTALRPFALDLRIFEPPEDNTCAILDEMGAADFDALPEVCDDGSENCVTYDDHLKDLALVMPILIVQTAHRNASGMRSNDGSGTCTDATPTRHLSLYINITLMTIPCALRVRMRATAGYCNQTKQKKWNDRIANVVTRKRKASAPKMKCIPIRVIAPRMMYPVPCRPNHGMTVTVLTCPNASVLSRTIRAVQNSARPVAPARRTPKNDAPATKKQYGCYKRVVEFARILRLRGPGRGRQRWIPGAHSSLVFRGGEVSNAMARAPKGTGTGTDSNNKLVLRCGRRVGGSGDPRVHPFNYSAYSSRHRWRYGGCCMHGGRRRKSAGPLEQAPFLRP